MTSPIPPSQPGWAQGPGAIGGAHGLPPPTDSYLEEAHALDRYISALLAYYQSQTPPDRKMIEDLGICKMQAAIMIEAIQKGVSPEAARELVRNFKKDPFFPKMEDHMFERIQGDILMALQSNDIHSQDAVKALEKIRAELESGAIDIDAAFAAIQEVEKTYK